MEFTESLRKVESKYLTIWNAKLINYEHLVDLLINSEENFFASLLDELSRINKAFLKLANYAVSEFAGRRPAWSLHGLINWFHRWRWRAQQNSTPAMYSLSHAVNEFSNANVLAVRTILKELDDHHQTEDGAVFWNGLWKTQNHSVDFIHSPLLVRLRAIESMEAVSNFSAAQCRLDGADLQCPICLDVLHQPVALTCGHVYCWSCMLEACQLQNCIGTTQALISNIPEDTACFECRQQGVFKHSKFIPELHDYLRWKFPKEWKERKQAEFKNLADKEARFKAEKKEDFSSFFRKLHYSEILAP